MEINGVGPHIGGEITGVDVKCLDASGFAPIYQAWLRYGVTVVRDQELEIPNFLDYARRYGRIVPHPSKTTRHSEYPELTVMGIDKFDAEGQLKLAVYRRGADHFHTDGAYDEEPFKATKLYALAVPSRGGDTHFSCMAMALEALPARLRDRIEGRRGAFTYGGRQHLDALLNPEDRDWTPVTHPLVRRHPETGRRSLYFDPGKIVRVEGLEPAESDDLIDELAERMLVPGAGYTHQWRAGDVVIWDNRCLVHRAAADYPPEEDRIHWRVSIKEGN